MRAKLFYKKTAHKAKCMLCGDIVEKGQICIRMSQCMYPGERVGYICKKHIKNSGEKSSKCEYCGKSPVVGMRYSKQVNANLNVCKNCMDSE